MGLFEEENIDAAVASPLPSLLLLLMLS